MITKIVEHDQLFVYYKGKLIYKRWLKTGASLVFEVCGLPWSPKEREAKNETH